VAEPPVPVQLSV
jgi:hypothetical protein